MYGGANSITHQIPQEHANLVGFGEYILVVFGSIWFVVDLVCDRIGPMEALETSRKQETRTLKWIREEIMFPVSSYVVEKKLVSLGRLCSLRIFLRYKQSWSKMPFKIKFYRNTNHQTSFISKNEWSDDFQILPDQHGYYFKRFIFKTYIKPLGFSSWLLRTLSSPVPVLFELLLGTRWASSFPPPSF